MGTYPSLYSPLSPSDILLSKSDSDLLLSRFRSEQHARIARDLDRENQLLCEYIEKGKLEYWFKTLLATFTEAAATDSIATGGIEQPNYHADLTRSPPSSAEASGTRAQFSWL